MKIIPQYQRINTKKNMPVLRIFNFCIAAYFKHNFDKNSPSFAFDLNLIPRDHTYCPRTQSIGRY